MRILLTFVLFLVCCVSGFSATPTTRDFNTATQFGTNNNKITLKDGVTTTNLNETTRMTLVDTALSSGTGSPEGVVTANSGSIYLRRDAGAGTALYVKESGTGNTGWVAYSSTGIGDGTANWTAGGTTNSLLSGTASTYNLVATNDVTLGGSLFYSTTNVLYRSGANLVYSNSLANSLGPFFNILDGLGNGASVGAAGNVVQLKTSGSSIAVELMDDSSRSVRWWSNALVPAQTSDLGSTQNRWRDVFVDRNIVWNGSTNTVFDKSGSGSPEGVVTASVGSIYRRYDGGSATTVYVKESGTGNTGWVAIGAGGGITQLTTDVTAGPGSGSQVATIANDAVNNAKLANMATQTIKGRTTAGTGDPEDLTTAQATALLNNLVGDSGAGGTKGLAPAPAAGDTAAGKFLKADGSWSVPAGSGYTSVLSFQKIGSGTDHDVLNPWSKVDFGGVDPEFVLTNAGTHLIIVTVGAFANNQFAQEYYLTNVTDGVMLPGSHHQIHVESLENPLVIAVQYTTAAANKTIQLWGQTDDTTYSGAPKVLSTRTVANVTLLADASGANGMISLGGLSTANQGFASTDLSISSLVATHTLNIANDAVTYAKMQNVSAASRLLGRGSAAGAGDVEEITLGSNLTMTGTSLAATDTDTGITQLTGDVTAGPGSGSQVATIAADSVALATDTTGPYVATIAGTVNQVNVAGSGAENAAVTLSTPQDIHTSATPQFARLGLGAAASATDSLTIAQGTLTADAQAIDATATWNNAGVTFTGIKYNVTDTASAAASLLMDLQVGGTSQWKVGKAGAVTQLGTLTVPNGSATAPQIVSAGSSTTGFGFSNSGLIPSVTVSGANVAQFASAQAQFIAVAFPNTSPDLYLMRDAANTLAQRNGVNAQTFRGYGTFTDASNYERWGLSATGGSGITLAAETAGTGVDNLSVTLSPAGTGGNILNGWVSQDGDVADAGYLRLQNAAIIGWEASPAGTDVTLTVDASEIMQASGTFNAVTLTEGVNAVPNATDHLGFFAATTSAQLAGVVSDEVGTGALTFATDPVFSSSLQIPNAAAPTTDAFGEIAGDNNAWAASRGAVQFFDGTANTFLVGALSSDTPSNGQVPKWNTGGTITWENDTDTDTDTGITQLTGDVTAGPGSGSQVATIAANSVALTTDTTGDYVASVGTSVLTGLTGGAAGSEGATLSLAFDYSQALTGDVGLAANAGVFGASGLVFEGATANLIETFISVTDPTVDRTITIPDRGGTISLSGDTFTGDVTGTIASGGSTALTIATDSVALTTDTTGNYVASVGTSVLTGLTGGSAGSEGAALSLAFDYSQALTGDVGLGANAGVFGASGFVFEGATANLLETFISITDPTVDRTITIPDRGGTVSLSGDTFTGDVTGTLDASGATALTAAAAITRDTEWDTIGEIETATSVNIIVNTEIDTSSEIATIVTDEIGSGSVLFGDQAVSTTSTPQFLRLGVGQAADSSVPLAITRTSTGTTMDQRGIADATGGVGLQFKKARGTGIGAETIVQSGDVIGNVISSGWDGVGYITGARIISRVDGTPGLNDMPGRIQFATTPDGSATLVERWRINNAGHFLAETDNTYDIGATGATRPRDIFVADDIEVGGDGNFTGNISANGVVFATVTKANADSPYTATASDYTILCNATAGAITINLPAAASHTGRIYNIKKTDSSVNAITIDGNAAETIDGDTTVLLGTQYHSLTIQCDGSNWHIL